MEETWIQTEISLRSFLEINIRKFSDQINSSEMDTILLVDQNFSSLWKILITSAQQAERALGLFTSSGITKTKSQYDEINLEIRKILAVLKATLGPLEDRKKST